MNADPRGDRAGLLDTSVLIARESGRRLDARGVPERTAVSVITVAELHAGVLAATDTETRARRLATVDAIAAVEALPITVEAARHWATLQVKLAESGLRAKVNDLWIAAVAMANGLDVVSQDANFDDIERVGGPRVVRV